MPDPSPLAPQEAYRVLARKYRPSDFTGLIGQDALVRTLSNAFALRRIAHAFMLTGVRGVGKTTTARIIARALNCVGPDGKRSEPTVHPCGQCSPCITIAESRNVDVQEMDAASNNGVEEVRQIIDSVRYAPASCRYKVYILDEVHMLSKPAFNAILKTLEEPPPHVKFIFATTEIRKVPVTVLSRCQRFDLRRIDSDRLARYLGEIAAKEKVEIEDGALALIARAAEGSARDALSLLDQAIAHNEKAAITAVLLRDMLGLADRGQVLDLFEKLMAGDVPGALGHLSALYDAGADPLAVMQDLLEITHFLTRLKVAPLAQGFFDGGSAEARRAAELAAKLQVSSLSRAWQMLLKGLIEVREATRPISACEMALIRLTYAAELPPTERLVKDLLDNPPSEGGLKLMPRRSGGEAPSPNPSATMPLAFSVLPQGEGRATLTAPRLDPVCDQGPVLRGLDDIAALAQKNGAAVLRVHIENDMHLVKLEDGRLEFRPGPRAPRSLAGDLQQKLRDWTGMRWTVAISNEPGEPTLAETKKNARAARMESAMQAPMVRAVLDRFPGSEIVAVREVAREELPQAETDE
ncbi:MAG: DNA polymerase III subunit gamma/tau [Rhizomicrobium sp.]